MSTALNEARSLPRRSKSSRSRETERACPFMNGTADDTVSARRRISHDSAALALDLEAVGELGLSRSASVLVEVP